MGQHYNQLSHPARASGESFLKKIKNSETKSGRSQDVANDLFIGLEGTSGKIVEETTC